MKRPVFLLLAAVVLALAACPRPRGLGLAPLEEALASSGSKGPRDQALAGFALWLLRGRPQEAAPLFASAAQAGDVWGLWGQSELARRSLDTRERVGAALRICELAPRHPLCAVAARLALASTGESPALDLAIEASALRALSAGALGDAAYYLRLAAASVRQNRGDRPGARALWADAGQVSAASLLGPYSRYHFLQWDETFPPEKGEASPGAGPYGPIVAREARAHEGRLLLGSEPTTADIYDWAADVQVAEEARYQLRAISRGSFRVLIDGELALDQREFEAWVPEERVVEVRLAPGKHRLVARTARGTEREDALWLGLARADGQPARLTFAAAHGALPPQAQPPALSPPAGSWPDAATLAIALEQEVGSALAAYVASRSATERDEEGALALADVLVQQQPTSAAFLVLRAEALMSNQSLPTRIARGRAHRDLEEALKTDPGEASALQRLSIHARGENRLDEAAELLERARQVAAPGSWRIVLSDMRLAQARGADALADELAQRALAQEPGLCDALDLRYDLARRLDAVALADLLVKDLGRCPGHDARQAEHLRARGDLAAARERFEALAEAHPLDSNHLQTAAQVALAQDKPLESAALWEKLQRSWPRHPLFHKRRAEALERAGDLAGARAEREAALALDGSDLKLRRMLAIEDGKEVLEDLKTDGAPLLARWVKEHGSERPTTSGAYILDASAIEAHPDGSFTERTHLLAKVLDQAGVSSLAEVHLPVGAEVLLLRTIKADGRILEPEQIGGKDGMSLPGVEVGDYVEYEYLASTSSRGAAMPGFAAPKFYFSIADGQLFHSTYTVRAPAGAGLAVDAHNLEAPPVHRDGSWDVVSLTRQEIPAFVREPGSPASEEVLPFVQVGAGAGLDESVASLGDFLLDRAKPNAEVTRFAQQAVGEKTGLEAVRALNAKVMQEV
ncbi:MAG: hypothetical protein HY901_05370 [Deltaproteobacteria bacterium]|nr:hypothetical protein [Deltaproteobacteria bacterium]